LVQVVMGLRRMKKKTLTWRVMRRYEAMKKSKSTGKAIIAAARKLATIIWQMLSEDVEFCIEKMVDKKLTKKSEVMSNTAVLAEAALDERQEEAIVSRVENKTEATTGVAREKRRKVG